MDLEYFPDTDVLLIHFTEGEIVDTYDFDPDVLVEVDAEGNLVSMTIHRATVRATIQHFSFLRHEVEDSRGKNKRGKAAAASLSGK